MAAWLSETMWFPALVIAFVLLPMAFPNGPAPSGIRRVSFWTVAAVPTVFVVATTFQARFNPADSLWIENPAGVLPIEDVEHILLPLLPFIAPLGVFDVVSRYRRARGVEREQIRWFLAAALASLALFVLNGLLDALAGVGLEPAMAVGLSLPPLGIWVAIQRHRLYDIDQLISRTLSYGLVTSVLVAVYASLVFLLSRMSPFRGDLAVATSTFTTAALFDPVRRRVQAATDRRFHRSRYDAARTVEDFAQRLTTQLDLAGLDRDLCRLAGDTLEPVSIALWLRDDGRDSALNPRSG